MPKRRVETFHRSVCPSMTIWLHLVFFWCFRFCRNLIFIEVLVTSTGTLVIHSNSTEVEKNSTKHVFFRDSFLSHSLGVSVAVTYIIKINRITSYSFIFMFIKSRFVFIMVAFLFWFNLFFYPVLLNK